MEINYFGMIWIIGCLW